MTEKKDEIIKERALPKVLLVDDEELTLRIMEEYLLEHDYEVFTATSGNEAIRIADTQKVDVVVCDIKMDGVSGHDVLRYMVANHPLVPVIMLTGYIDIDMAIKVMREGARDYLTKPLEAKALIEAVENALKWRERTLARQRQQQATRVYQRELERKLETADLRVQKAALDVVRSFSNAMAVRSKHLIEHSRRVARLTTLFSRELGLDSEKSRLLQQAAMLHDIGKLGLPDNLIEKTELFAEDEAKTWRKHIKYGVSILEPILYFKPILTAVKHHHERWDGQGFPDKLAGEAIPFPARILAIVDAYDNMTTERSYRKALSPKDAYQEILKSKGKRFDPELAEKFGAVLARITKI